MALTIHASEIFLRDAVSKHFVFMSYRAALPGESRERAKRYFASCFVIEAAGAWFLITAGHTINNIQASTAKGSDHFWFYLHDRAAGNQFEGGVPIPFQSNLWVVIEDDSMGMDYAAWPLPELVVRNLEAGGVAPLRSRTWGEAPLTQYPVWVLAGIPLERIDERPKSISVGLALLPLEPISAPPASASVTAGRTFARIVTDEENDGVAVRNVLGMSGGPVFGVRPAYSDDELRLTYWVIGIQSSWMPTERVVSFCPSSEFFEACQKAVLKLGAARGDAGTTPQKPGWDQNASR